MNCYARILTLSIALMLCMGASAQQLSLGKTPYFLNKSAVLDLNADNQGLLLPRIADTAAINLLTPPDGMLIYSVPMKRLLLRANGFWQPLPVAASLGSYWATAGNANGSAQKLGNTDNFDLSIITNNLERMRILAGGNVGIGTAAPNALLHVQGANPLRLTGVQPGTNTTADSLLTITAGLVRKLPVATFQNRLSGTGFVKASGTTITYDNNSYTLANVAITAATKTKISYDSKGLVTGGADATTSDIAEGSRLYFTDDRVLTAPLTGFSAATATPATATDNILGGIGKLQGQINAINGASYLTGNQTITLSGDVSGSGATAITTAIGNNKVTLPHLAQVATGTFLGRTSTGTGNVEALTAAQAKSLLSIGGTNSGDVALAGQTYLSLAGQTITANPVDLSGNHATGTLAAARFGALTGDVTNTAGSYATTIGNGVVTYGKIQNISATNRLLGRASAGAGITEEITIGSGLALSGTTLSATGSGMWSTTGNSATNWNTHFIGSTDNNGFRIRTNNTERFVIDSMGRVGVGISDPANLFAVRDTMEIRRTGAVSSLLFTNTSGSGDFRIGGDGGDIFWQGGGGRNLQMGAHWGIVLAGDRQVAAFPAFAPSTSGINVTIPAQRAASIPLAIQAAAGQTAHLTEWRNSGGTALGVVDAAGNFGIGTTAPAEKLQVTGNLRFSGALMPGGSAGTLGNVLVSSGSGAAPIWQDGASYMNGTAWVQGGNSFSSIKNFGTTSNHDLPFITNNLERMRVLASGNVGIGTSAPNALLHVQGANPLRLTGVQPGGTTTADSLLTINNGTVQKLPLSTFTSSSDVWNLTGNSGISWNTHFLGTTDNASLRFRTNNTERFLIDSLGNLAVGNAPQFTAVPHREKLLVDAGATTSYNIMGVKGSINSYMQMNLQNRSSGNAASTDIVATADNGSETNNYVDMGINSSGYSGGYFGAANDAYLYNLGQDFLIGNGTAGKKLYFLTGGGDEAANTRMTIDGTGNVGIGTSTPTEKLDVAGNIRLTGNTAKKILFGALTGDVDASIGMRNTPVNEQQEMLFYVGNDNDPAYGPDRIRMVAEEFRLQTFNNAGNSSMANAESETGTNTRLLINAAGNVAIGSSSFDATNPEELLVDAGTTTSFNLIKAKGSVNNYLQLNVQNSSSGTVASSDVVATANNGTETSGFINMGINSSGFTDNTAPLLTGINTAYLYSTGRNLMIGNAASTTYKLGFFTGGTATANERMTILGTGNVGVGTASPAQKLTVAGIVAPSADNSFTMGTSALRWSILYATNGTVNTSDRREKKNIKPLAYGLKEVMGLQPVSYNWRDTAHRENKIGLIAQEVRQLVPEVVVGNEEKETLGMNYAELVPVLINAIKEQQKEIDALKAQQAKEANTKTEIDALKQEMKTMMDKINKLEKRG